LPYDFTYLATLVFSKEANEKIDLGKCLKMALLHDLVEIGAGDQIVYAEDKNKFEREKKAAERIFGLLPPEMRNEFLEVWIEFEKKESPESKYVGALDRFLPLYSNVLNDGHSWKKHGITLEKILNLNKPAISAGSTSLWAKADEFLKTSVKNGVLKS